MTIFLQIDLLLILELSAWVVIFTIPAIIISNYLRERKKGKYKDKTEWEDSA